MDAITQFKEAQKKVWSAFAPMELYTCVAAARLVKFAGVQAAHRMLDVACGTGVVALSASRLGARVTGLDLTPELVEHARENAATAQAKIDFHQGDVEALPFEDATFDVVTSQFGHMFAPRPEMAIREMLRVLKPGGTIAFSTWPPELYTGRMFQIVGKHLPKPPIESPPPILWGSPDVVRQRLGDAVEDVVFDRAVMRSPYLSPAHVRATLERGVGPYAIAAARLAGEPERLAAFRAEIDALTGEYFEPEENVLRQDYLMTRAKKAAR